MKRVNSIALIFIAGLLLVPLWMMLTGSFQPLMAFTRMPPSVLPFHPTLDNYKTVLTNGPLSLWAVNTVFVVGGTVMLGIVVNGSAGYVFAFARFRGKQVIFWTLLSSTFVTRYSLLISQFVIVQKLSLPPLVAVVSMTVFWPVGLFLFRNYFATIPASLIETARMDGAREFVVFMRVVAPCSLPILGAAIVFLGMAAMQDYIWQNILLLDANEMTLLVGFMHAAQANIINHTIKNFGLDFAIASLITLPLAVIFSVGSKYFIGGLTGGAVKE